MGAGLKGTVPPRHCKASGSCHCWVSMAPPITVFSVPTARLKAAWGWCCQEACLNKESRTSDWEGKHARKTKGATLWTKPLLTKPRAASIKIGNNS